MCALRNVTTAKDLSPVILVLQLYLTTHKPILQFTAVRLLSKIASTHASVVTPCNVDLETLIPRPEFGALSSHQRQLVDDVQRAVMETEDGLRAQAQLKRWIRGTLQDAMSGEHLQEYLWEFEFRFNRRKANKPGLLFYRLMEQAVLTPPLTYEQQKACTLPKRQVSPTPPVGPRSSPRSLDQPDAGRPWRTAALRE